MGVESRARNELQELTGGWSSEGNFLFSRVLGKSALSHSFAPGFSVETEIHLIILDPAVLEILPGKNRKAVQGCFPIESDHELVRETGGLIAPGRVPEGPGIAIQYERRRVVGRSAIGPNYAGTKVLRQARLPEQ